MDRNRAKGRMLLLREQLTLRQRYPDAHVEIDRSGKLVWRGWLSPSPLSHDYWVEITWSGVGVPRTVVLEPKLEPPEGMALRHVFADGSLCLFMPGGWRSTMLIVDTIIPWTLRWLYHHEIYLFTCEWTGGGHGTPVEEKLHDDPAA